jgi:RES domain-containing protein
MTRPALAPSPFLREVAFVNEVGHLSDADIARATGAAPSTARAWLAGTRAPTGQRAERVIELSALVERLTRVMDPSYIAVWLRKPVPALDDDKPLEVIGRGDYRRVAKILSALEESPAA